MRYINFRANQVGVHDFDGANEWVEDNLLHSKINLHQHVGLKGGGSLGLIAILNCKIHVHENVVFVTKGNTVGSVHL